MTTVGQRVAKLRDVGAAPAGIGQEVEHRAIVPDVDAAGRQVDARDVTLHPAYLRGVAPEAVSHGGERFAGDIQHGDRFESRGEQIVDERRRAAADVENAGTVRGARRPDQRQRSLQVWSIPAHRVGRFRSVHIAPMAGDRAGGRERLADYRTAPACRARVTAGGRAGGTGSRSRFLQTTCLQSLAPCSNRRARNPRARSSRIASSE